MSLALAQQAPSFALPGIDGREHTLESYGDADVLVLIQSCNHCPYVLAWEDRMKAIQRDYADRGVRSSRSTRTTRAATRRTPSTEMIDHAASVGLNFDYLHDERSGACERARRPSGRPRCSSSTGSASSSTTARSTTTATTREVGSHYLREALDALLEGHEPAVAETPPVGCSVKWLP